MKTEIKFGVWLSPSGKLKVFEKSEDGFWLLDEGMEQNHPLFRGKIRVVKEMSQGWPVFDSVSDLKNHEYLGEL